VFATVDVYPVDEKEGEVIAVASPAAAIEGETLLSRAATLQERYHFRYPLPSVVTQRREAEAVPDGELLTDDFAPVNLYETMVVHGARRRR